MFQRRIFGRKPSSAASPFQAQSTPVVESNGRLSYEAIAERVTISLIGKQTDSYSWNRALMERIAELTPVERGELLVSLAPYAAEIQHSEGQGGADLDAQRKRLCYKECRFRPYEIPPDALRDFVALIVGTPGYSLSQYAAKPFVAQIKKAVAAGGFLSSHECTLLTGYAEALRTKRAYQKAEKKAYAELAAAVDKIAGVEISASSVLLDRCEDAETGHSLGELPDNYDFWIALFAATAQAMGELFDDVRARKAPLWMRDPAAFAAAFPPAGPFTPRFGAWNDCQLEALRDFAFLRQLHRRTGLATPDRYLALRDQRSIVEPMIRIAWNTPAIPGLDRLGDLETPAVTELLELLVTSKGGPRPTASWVKKALKIANDIGIEQTEARLHDWLALFHTPCSTPETMAAAANCYSMDEQINRLNEAYPTWPVEISPEIMPACARALALGLAGGNSDNLRHWSSTSFTMRVHLYKGKNLEQGMLRLPSPDRSWYGVTTQSPSFENEQLLRAVVWLLPALPDTAAAIVTLEKTALAAASRLRFSGDSIRAKAVANSAIAGLIAIGSDEAGLALLRLSQQIEDRGISAPIVAALNA